MDLFKRFQQWFKSDGKATTSKSASGAKSKKKKKNPRRCTKMKVNIIKPTNAEFLGVSVITRNEQVIVVGVESGSPADGHLLVNDRIRTVNGKHIADADQFEYIVQFLTELYKGINGDFIFDIFRPKSKKVEKTASSKSDEKCERFLLDYLNIQIKTTSKSLKFRTRKGMKKLMNKLKRQANRNIRHLHDNDLSLAGLNNAMYNVKVTPEHSDIRRIIAKSAGQVLQDFMSDYGRTDESSNHSATTIEEVDFQSQMSNVDDFWHMESSKSIREDEQVNMFEPNHVTQHRIGTDVAAGTRLKRPTAHTV